jgi:hypothetical protein
VGLKFITRRSFLEDALDLFLPLRKMSLNYPLGMRPNCVENFNLLFIFPANCLSLVSHHERIHFEEINLIYNFAIRSFGDFEKKNSTCWSVLIFFFCYYIADVIWPPMWGHLNLKKCILLKIKIHLFNKNFILFYKTYLKKI